MSPSLIIRSSVAKFTLSPPCSSEVSPAPRYQKLTRSSTNPRSPVRRRPRAMRHNTARGYEPNRAHPVTTHVPDTASQSSPDHPVAGTPDQPLESLHLYLALRQR